MWKNRYTNPLQYFETLDSTNLEAARAAKAGAGHGTLIVADRQTAGRGRKGRSWESPAGKNLYFSLLLRPRFAPDKAPMVTLVMAHSVAGAMEETVQAAGQNVSLYKAGIKWPNDILINGKKVCGILTEMCLLGTDIEYIIVGVGINVKEQEFSGELSEKASSLNKEWGADISREELLQRIMAAFWEDYNQFEEAGDLLPLLGGYQSRLLNLDKEVKVLDPQKPFEGVARGITKNGELIVEMPDGSKSYVYAGEVSVRGKQGYI